MWDYSDKVNEYFLNPKNVGELKDANAIGEVGSMTCGDALKLYLKIEDNIIKDAKFQTFGCASAIASSSILTEMIIGKTIEEAEKITNKDITNALGGLPKEKMHCSVMGQEALEAAIRNYRGLTPIKHADDGGKLICKCFGVTDTQIIKAIKENNLTTLKEITNYTKAGGACGKCLEDIQVILDTVLAKKPQLTEIKTSGKKTLTNVQRMQKVMQVIEEDIRPRLQQDGGDIELVDVANHRVIVKLHGRCSSCRASHLTIHGLVEKTLRDQVEESIVVEEV